MLVGQHPGDVGEQPVAVQRLDLELHEEHAGAPTAPTRPRSMPVRLAVSSDSALVQSVRCTETPLPRVTKPMIGSPGTGVQHRASLTQHVGRARRRRRPGRRLRRRGARVGMVASARSSLAPSSPPSDCDQPAHDVTARTRGPRPPRRTGAEMSG